MSLNFQRVKAGEGRPLEVIDSIRGVNDALDQYAEATTGYERARFGLLVALGMPPESMLDPNLMPSPSCPPETRQSPAPGEANQEPAPRELVPAALNPGQPPAEAREPYDSGMHGDPMREAPSVPSR